MKVIYVAGPFRAPTQWAIAENIRAAERVGFLIARAGAMPLIPHANTAHFHGIGTDQFWIDGTLALLERCDGAVFIGNWSQSIGSVGEWERCMALGLPHIDVSYSTDSEVLTDVIRLLQRIDGIYGQEHQAEEQREASSPASDGT